MQSLTCNVSSEAQVAVTDLYEWFYPGPACPDKVWECLCVLARLYPEVATYDAIPWIVDKFEPILVYKALRTFDELLAS